MVKTNPWPKGSSTINEHAMIKQFDVDSARCLIFDNGIEYDGPSDPQIEALREKYGELIDTDTKPRLIILRENKVSDVKVKISISFDADVVMLTKISNFLIHLDQGWKLYIKVNAILVDWPSGPFGKTEAPELQLEIMTDASRIGQAINWWREMEKCL